VQQAIHDFLLKSVISVENHKDWLVSDIAENRLYLLGTALELKSVNNNPPITENVERTESTEVGRTFHPPTPRKKPKKSLQTFWKFFPH
jgi:hypothetical protein